MADEDGTYLSWVPFTNVTANYTNCTAASTFLAAIVANVDASSGDIDLPIMSLYGYIVSLVPDGVDIPSIGQAMEWFTSGADENMYDAMLQYPYTECVEEVCRDMTWSGDTDLAGIGVVIVYYLAAALATLYFIIVSIDQWEPFRRAGNHHRRWSWFAGAFNESLPTFMDTALIFSISMNASAVYRHGSSRMHPDKTHSIYQLTNSTYIGIFTIFAPVMLQLITHHRRRLRIRAVLWMSVVALAATNVGLYFSLTTSSDHVFSLLSQPGALADAVWEMDCEPTTIRNDLDGVLVASCVLLGLNFLVFAYHTFQPTRTRDTIRSSIIGQGALAHRASQMSSHGRTWWENLQRVGKIIDGVLCGILMWVVLAFYTAYRSAVTAAMGDDNANLQWSFSQVLALATWVPVVFDLVTIYIYGAKDTLEGKVSETYRVVENEGKNSVAMYYKGDEASASYQATNLDPYQVVDPYQGARPDNGDSDTRGLLRQ